MPEVLLYGDIYSWSAQDVINQMNTVPAEDELTIPVNCDGGEVRYGWGIIACIQRRTGQTKLINDGVASSMAAMTFCYVPVENCSAVDTAEFNFHRAAYPDWFESNPEYFTDEDKASLNRMNTMLRKALEARIDKAKFEELKNIKIKDLFSMNGRPNVCLTAIEAKEVGLISKITNITPKRKAEIEAKLVEASAKYNPVKIAAKAEPEIKSKNMDIAKLKAEYPALYNEVFKLGKKKGIALAKDTAESWAIFAKVDPEAVQKGIASGEAITNKQVIEFSRKEFSAAALKTIESENAEDVNTDTRAAGAKPVKEEEKAKAEFKNELFAKLKIKTPA